jgi:lipoprotein-anchoring transpeptidase ErfK/SrfK
MFRQRPRRWLAAPLVALATIVAGCSHAASGDNFRFSADQLSAPTTTPAPTTAAPPPVPTTEVATAKVPEVQVFAQPPAGSAAPVGMPMAYQASGALPPIPRVGFASAGSRKTADGWAFTNPTFFKNPLVFQVIEHDGDYLKVWVPARPNQQQGWIRASDVDLSTTTYRMELSVSQHHLKVYDGATLVADSQVVDGTPSTKTPLGHFYINEKIKSDNPAGAYGYWILSTSGYSEDLNLFDNGLPVIAFHGTNQPELIGQSKSNGCIRMPNDVDQQLAAALPAGTPVDISA